MNVFKPEDGQFLHTLKDPSVFLAGSIEMGKADDWQTKLANEFSTWTNVVFFNPRRAGWDSSWEQRQSAINFNYQVNWELNHLEAADIIFMYFAPDTKSPISLLELGAYGTSGKMIVCCPDEFWRKGNVEVFCTRNNIPLFNTMEDAIGALKTKLHIAYAVGASKTKLHMTRKLK
jgi:hypothetical protein